MPIQEKKSQVIKSNALLFNDPECFAKTLVNEDGSKKLEMVAYSGGVILNHWYWGNVAFDLEGVKLPSGPSPILEEHSLSRKIGIARKYSTENNKLEIVKSSFVSTEFSDEFQKLSSEGFPFQCSIRGMPIKVEQVAEGAKTKVNGFTLKGPGHVWREWALQESSICVFGSDTNTSARAFAETKEVSINFFMETVEKNQDKGEKQMFDFVKFKGEHPDAFSALEKEIGEKVTRDLEDKFNLERTGFAKQINDLTVKATSMSDEYKERLQKLETSLAASQEKELRFEAETIFNEKISKTKLSDKQREKINLLVSYTQFVANNQLDKVAFAAALDTEIKEWHEFSVPDTAPAPLNIQGFGSYQKEPGTQIFTEESAEAEAEKLLKFIK